MITEGNLRDFSLADLLQILELNRATGTLTLSHRGRSGVLACSEGLVVGARLGERGGEEAIYALFHWDGGTFAFEPDTRGEGLAPVSAPHADLVREGIHRLDSWKHLRRECPALTSGARLNPTPESAQDDQDAVLRLVQQTPGITLSQLSRSLGTGEIASAKAILALWSAGHVQVVAAPDVALGQGFKLAIELLHATFASISGLKMVEAFDERFREGVEQQGVPLAWMEGRLLDEWLDDVPLETRSDVYRALLENLLEHAVRLHGAAFEERFIGQLRQVWPPELLDTGERLGLAWATAPASPSPGRNDA